MDKLETMEKFLETDKLPRLNHEEIENRIRLNKSGDLRSNKSVI